MNRQLLNVVIAPLIYDKKILLIKRRKQPFKDLWSMPGGKLEFGEHIEDALIREIFEETGLIVKPKKVLAILGEIFFDVKKAKDYWHTLIFLCEVVIKNTPTVKESTEGQLEWFSINKLPKSQIVPSDYKMIKQIILRPVETVHYYKIRILDEEGKFAVDYFKK